jgi:hypothetical protein
MNKIVKHLCDTQEAAGCQDKKGFRFAGKKGDNFSSLVAVYTEKTDFEHMTDAKRFAILGTLLEDEAELMYNDQLHMKDKSVALEILWGSLKLAYEREEDYMQKICDLSSAPPVENSVLGMKKLQKDLLRCRSLIPQDKTELLDIPAIVKGFGRRLPTRFRQQYATHTLGRALDGTTKLTFKNLVEFVTMSIRVAESDPLDWVEEPCVADGRKERATYSPYLRYSKNITKRNYNTNTIDNNDTSRKLKPQAPPTTTRRRITNEDLVCGYCREKGHAMWKCPEYMALSTKERWALVKQERRCPNCLSKHDISECTSNYICYKCNARHNSTLCHKNENNHAFVDMHAPNNVSVYKGPEDDEEDGEISTLHGSKSDV